MGVSLYVVGARVVLTVIKHRAFEPVQEEEGEDGERRQGKVERDVEYSQEHCKPSESWQQRLET